MTNDKDAAPGVRTTRESEIFREPPGSGNYSSSIGAAQGIELFSGSDRVRRARPAKTVFEPGREIPVFAKTDVLVVGGGPAGTAAAIAAARVGADVLLVERYNHLGGLSTGGLVIWIDRMTDWSASSSSKASQKSSSSGRQRMLSRDRPASTGESAMPRPPPIGRNGPPLTRHCYLVADHRSRGA
jgi:hypothetical protein